MAERTRSRPPSKVNGFSREPVSRPERPYVAPAVSESAAPLRASEKPSGFREVTFEDIVWGGYQYGALVPESQPRMSPPQEWWNDQDRQLREWWDDQERQFRAVREQSDGGLCVDIDVLMTEREEGEDDDDAVKDPKAWLTALLMIMMFAAFGFGAYLLFLAFGGNDILGIGEPFLRFFKQVVGPKIGF